MTCIAGSVHCIENVAVADCRVAFNQQINAIVPNEDEVLYLYWFTLLSKPTIHQAINMALKEILSKGQLSEMMLPIPASRTSNAICHFCRPGRQIKICGEIS